MRGSGGQALGLEAAGFEHALLVEIDPFACQTLRGNRPSWKVHEGDLRSFKGSAFKGVELLAGGVPCPPFSKAGKQLGKDDERDLFPEAIRLIDEMRPKAVMLENVRGLLDPAFDKYRAAIDRRLEALGYKSGWKLLQASDFGVSQLRPRVVLVGVRREYSAHFAWPSNVYEEPQTVGALLKDLMASNRWKGAHRWSKKANGIAPTLVGGSKKHGGPDLGPTRAKRAWAELHVDGHGLANDAPMPDFELDGMPKLTVRMTARIQGFPDSWQFFGGKTASYRQIGNAFPPPVACAVGEAVRAAISVRRSLRVA